jgi:hypothetical protein
MSAIATQFRITPEQLENLPDSKNYEFVDRELVERDVSILSRRVAVVVSMLLDVEAARTKEAQVFANDLGYQFYPDDPDQIRNRTCR